MSVPFPEYGSIGILMSIGHSDVTVKNLYLITVTIYPIFRWGFEDVYDTIIRLLIAWNAKKDENQDNKIFREFQWDNYLRYYPSEKLSFLASLVVDIVVDYTFFFYKNQSISVQPQCAYFFQNLSRRCAYFVLILFLFFQKKPHS